MVDSVPEAPSLSPLLPPRRRGEGGPFRGGARVESVVMIEGAVLAAAAAEDRSPMRIQGGGDRFRWFATKSVIPR